MRYKLTKLFLLNFFSVPAVVKNFHVKASGSFCHSTPNPAQTNNSNSWSTNFATIVAMQVTKLQKKKDRKKKRKQQKWRSTGLMVSVLLVLVC